MESADYRTIKYESERQISILEGKLVEASTNNNGIGPLLDQALKNVSRLPELYKSADAQGKRQIISSMYPEKLAFDGVQHRTIWINEAIRVFDTVKAVFEEKRRANPLKKLICPVW